MALARDGSNDGKSYWFTVNALSFGAAGIDGEYPLDTDDPFGGFGGSQALREMNLQMLGDRDYFITPVLDMVARVEDFNLRELLAWTTVFIKVITSAIQTRNSYKAATTSSAEQMRKSGRSEE